MTFKEFRGMCDKEKNGSDNLLPKSEIKKYQVSDKIKRLSIELASQEKEDSENNLYRNLSGNIKPVELDD